MVCIPGSDEVDGIVFVRVVLRCLGVLYGEMGGVSYRAGGRGGWGRDCSIWGWWIRGCNRGWGLGGLAGG